MYQNVIYRTAFLYVKNESDALDIVQDTAYRSFKVINRLKNVESFQRWVVRIAINCALDVLKKKKNIVQWESKSDALTSIQENEDIELTLTLLDLIEILIPEEKSIILLRFYQDLTIKEISRTLELPLGTVKTILYRSLVKLRENYKGGAVHE